MKNEQKLMVGTNVYIRNELLIRRVLSIYFVSITFAATYLGSVPAARGAVSECDRVWGSTSGIVTEQVDYVPKTPGLESNLRSSLVEGLYIIRLRGWLYHAANRVIKDAPVLIYNHGSGREPGEPCAIAKMFVKNGFVVFVPLRRGHIARTPVPVPLNWKKIESTGVYHEDYIDIIVKRSATAHPAPKGLARMV